LTAAPSTALPKSPLSTHLREWLSSVAIAHTLRIPPLYTTPAPCYLASITASPKRQAAGPAFTRPATIFVSKIPCSAR